MLICDPETNPILGPTTCYEPTSTTIAIFYGIAAVATIASTAVSMVASSEAASQQAAAARAQAAAQEAQAAQVQQIANYNAQIQRQNAEVAYQMSVYQAQQNAQIAEFNIRSAQNNAAFAEAQAFGASQAYAQGVENAKQLEFQAEAARAEGREAARRQREENERAIAEVRSKYGASGVTFEGSPLVVLAESAKLGESIAQDIGYATELESRKQLRAGAIEKFKAGFSLLEARGHQVTAENERLRAQTFAFERDLYKYDAALAGVRLNIENKEARLTELAGGAEAYGLRAQAETSRYAANIADIQGLAAVVSGSISMIGQAASAYAGYGYTKGVMSGKWGAPTKYSSGGPSGYPLGQKYS